jgi:hypothetical protein
MRLVLILAICICFLAFAIADEDRWGRGDYNLTKLYETDVPDVVNYDYHLDTSNSHHDSADAIQKLLSTLVNTLGETHSNHEDAVATTKETFDAARKKEEIARQRREEAQQKVIIKQKELQEAEEEYRIAIEVHEKAKKDLNDAWNVHDKTIIAHNEFFVNMVEEKKLVNTIHQMMSKFMQVRKDNTIPDLADAPIELKKQG